MYGLLLCASLSSTDFFLGGRGEKMFFYADIFKVFIEFVTIFLLFYGLFVFLAMRHV